MGKLNLPKIGKRRSSASVLEQLPRPSMALPRTPSMQLPKPQLPKRKSSSAAAQDAIEVVCLASMRAVAVRSAVGDASTISSAHSDSLTSFMGNLSPPVIEGFGSSGSYSVPMSPSAVLQEEPGEPSPHQSQDEDEDCEEEESSGPPLPPEDTSPVEEAELMRRWLPKRMSSRLSRARSQADESATRERHGSILDGFHGVVEVGHELPDDDATVATVNVVLGTYPLCVDVACFDDEGVEIAAVELASKASQASRKSKSRQCPSLRLKMKHSHRNNKSPGAVVAHLNALYSSKRQSSGIIDVRDDADSDSMAERLELKMSEREEPMEESASIIEEPTSDEAVAGRRTEERRGDFKAGPSKAAHRLSLTLRSESSVRRVVPSRPISSVRQ